MLNNKLNKKLSNLNVEIENKIYKSLLKPTLRKLEKNLQNNFDSIKEKLRSHSVNFTQANIKNIKSTRPIKYSNYSSYFNDLKNNYDSKNTSKKIFEINTNNFNYNDNSKYDYNYEEDEENNFNYDNNILETEKIKRNIVEKQQQLNDLLFKLNNKQNESLNYFISFRQDNRSFDINQK